MRVLEHAAADFIFQEQFVKDVPTTVMDAQLQINVSIVVLDSTCSKELATPIAHLDLLPIMLPSNVLLVTVLAEHV
jgi:hypothetical protein